MKCIKISSIIIVYVFINGCVSYAEKNAADFIEKNKNSFKVIENFTQSDGGDSLINSAIDCTESILNAQGGVSFDELITSRTDAFLIYKNGLIICKYIKNSGDSSSLLESWSIGKSITSVLIGIAIEKGYIDSVDDAITKYIPELIEYDKDYKLVTIKNLLEMRSGIEFNEDYFQTNSDVAQLLLVENTKSFLKKQRSLSLSDGKFNYSSFDYQLLGIAIENSSGMKLPEFASTFLWSKINAQHKAYWLADRSNLHTKSFCCFRATLGDYLRFSLMILNHGKFEGNTIVNEQWIINTTDNPTSKNHFVYGQGWWHRNSVLPNNASLSVNGKNYLIENEKIYLKEEGFGAEGVMGQFIYIDPKESVVILRFGKSRGIINWQQKFSAISKSKTD